LFNKFNNAKTGASPKLPVGFALGTYKAIKTVSNKLIPIEVTVCSATSSTENNGASNVRFGN
jgi:hypothetical protein